MSLLLKSIYSKKTVERISFLSKLWYFLICIESTTILKEMIFHPTVSLNEKTLFVYKYWNVICMDLEAICNWQASNICKTIMTQFLTFTDNETPPSERQNISENDLLDHELEDNHYAGNFESKWLSILTLLVKDILRLQKIQLT